MQILYLQLPEEKALFFITSHRLSGTEEGPVAVEAKRENSFPFCDECPSYNYSGESASLVLLDNIHHHWQTKPDDTLAL